MFRPMAALAGLTVLALSTTAGAQLPSDARAKLQQAVDRCGNAYGTLVNGQRPFDAGPFLYEVLAFADRAGATDPDRQNLRIDFNNAADRNERKLEAAPAELSGEVTWCTAWRG